MFKGLNITCVVYILALYFYNSGGLRVFNHFLRLISFLFCYFLIFLRIFSLVIFLNFFLNFLKKQALVSYKIKKNKVLRGNGGLYFQVARYLVTTANYVEKNEETFVCKFFVFFRLECKVNNGFHYKRLVSVF